MFDFETLTLLGSIRQLRLSRVAAVISFKSDMMEGRSDTEAT